MPLKIDVSLICKDNLFGSDHCFHGAMSNLAGPLKIVDNEYTVWQEKCCWCAVEVEVRHGLKLGQMR